ncbi:DUF4407 domain-containing protein [Mucilaginibacter psychrotolerans]|uniref:DUF4407 domain-containing protein n=1 Tax=Mucilaginibacter psychrotolerans TaxID=1524096 RepID=A0A4Y8S3W4_9SPHI|nr:DUF4407 domain-containing protein [Mucilaginibacter psychrotolerans]TFF33633.1 DUF4407 domain-containing protein [Mucilaginibacter psychrotolerans]
MEEKTKKTIQKKHEPKLNIVNRFLCRIAGCDLSILAQCKHEIVRHARVGAIVILTALLASVSMGFAIYKVTGNTNYCLLCGGVWGVAIFILDSYIVASYKKKGGWFAEFKMLLPRLILALIIGWTISIPLELKVFAPEVKTELGVMADEDRGSHQHLLDSLFTRNQTVLNNRKDTLQALFDRKSLPINNLNTAIDKQRKAAEDESSGVGRTKKRGDGPIHQEMLRNLYRDTLRRFQLEHDSLYLQYQAELKQVDKEMNAQKPDSAARVVPSGLAAELTALHRQMVRNEWVGLAYWLFWALLIAFETAPVMVKYFTPSGAYDEILNAKDEAEKKHQRQKLKEIKILYEAENKAIDSINTKKQQTQDALNAELLTEIANSQGEIARVAIRIWKNKMIKKVQENVDDFIRSGVPALNANNPIKPNQDTDGDKKDEPL